MTREEISCRPQQFRNTAGSFRCPTMVIHPKPPTLLSHSPAQVRKRERPFQSMEWAFSD